MVVEFISDKTIEVRLKEHDFSSPIKEVGFAPGKGYIIVLKHDRNQTDRNIFMVDLKGEIKWQIASCRPSNAPDDIVEFYTGVFIEEGPELYATTWGCFRHKIDWETGKILETEFTK